MSGQRSDRRKRLYANPSRMEQELANKQTTKRPNSLGGMRYVQVYTETYSTSLTQKALFSGNVKSSPLKKGLPRLYVGRPRRWRPRHTSSTRAFPREGRTISNLNSPVRFRKSLLKLVMPILLMSLAILGVFPNALDRSSRVPQTTASSRAPEQEFANALSTLKGGSGPASAGALTCTNDGPLAASCSANTASPTASPVPGFNTAADPATWTNLNLTTPSPPPRQYSSMTYDAADGYVLLFGGAGLTGGVGDLRDTWKFSAGSWTQLFPSTSPQQRYAASMAYDAADGYVVLFSGGSDMNSATCFGTCGDTWQFKAGTWTQLSPATSPTPRAFASMSYDAADSYVILFGGSPYGAGPLNDTWEFKAGSWTQLSPSSAPSPRSYASMVYDVADGYVLLFGGDGVPGDTWQFRAGTWTQLSPSNAPSRRSLYSMAYDATDGYALLFSGSTSTSDTWQFKAGSWTQLAPSSSPPATSGSSMAYDTGDGYFVLFGGYEPTYITWEFKTGTWTTQLSTSSSPLQRQTSSIVYDATDGYVLLFGGYNGISLNDTWQFKTGTWTRLSTLSSPSPRYYSSMAYDAADGYVLLFGGANGTLLNDTWQFKAGSWTQLSPPTAPSPRYGASMAYDAADGYVLLFGGENGGVTSLLGDTWEFKAGSWTQLSPSSSPQIRAFGLMAFDAADGYALLFGGSYYSCNSLSCTSVPHDDTWEYKAGTWVQLFPSISPSARWLASMVYNAADGYVLLFGGYDGLSMLGDTWKLVPSSLILTTTRISCSSPVVLGVPTSCTATVKDTFTNPTPPTGIVNFTLVAGTGTFSSPKCTLSTSGSSASCQVVYTSKNSPDTGVTETLSASYSGDSSHGLSSSTFNLSVLPRTTTSSLSCLPGSVAVTGSTVCTVTVTDVSPGTIPNPLAGHGVTFSTNESGTFSSSSPVQNVCVLGGTDPIASCAVSYTPSAVGTGTHMISTGFSTHWHAASFSNFNITVTPAPPRTTTTSVFCDTPVVVNQGSMCTATVTDTSATGATTPTGDVVLKASGVSGTFTLCPLVAGSTAGVAICTSTFTPSTAGMGAITGAYHGDNSHSGSTSTAASVTVNLRTTSTRVSCDTPVIVNQGSPCTATTTDTSAASPSAPAGTVTLSTSFTGSFDSISCTLIAGAAASATCHATFTPFDTGTASISGTYTPTDTTHSGSSTVTSASVVVSPRTTSIIITCSSPVTVNTASVCNVTVKDTSTAGMTLTPSGVVGLSLGAGSTSTGTFGSPTCTLVLVDAASSSCVDDFTGSIAGSAIVSASYAGDTAYSGSQGSASVTVTPAAPSFDYTLSISPTSASVVAGSSVTAILTASLTSGTAQPVALTLSISPNPSICQSSSLPCGTITLAPTSISPTSTGVISALTISTTTVAPPGTYTITITGLPPGKSSSSAALTLTITAPSISTVSFGHEVSCSVRSNSTLSNVRFAGNTIHVEATGPHGAVGYANVTVPKSDVPHLDTLHIFIDNSRLSSSSVTITSNSTAYFIYFTFTFHSPVLIDIQLTAPENAATPNILGLDPTIFYALIGVLVVLVVAIAAFALRKRKSAIKP